jgi:hypothetical protein
MIHRAYAAAAKTPAFAFGGAELNGDVTFVFGAERPRTNVRKRGELHAAEADRVESRATAKRETSESLRCWRESCCAGYGTVAYGAYYFLCRRGEPYGAYER